MHRDRRCKPDFTVDTVQTKLRFCLFPACLCFSKATCPGPLQDSISMPRSNDNSHTPGRVPSTLGNNTLIHHLITASSHCLVNAREHVTLHCHGNVTGQDRSIFTVFDLYRSGAFRRIFRTIAEP